MDRDDTLKNPSPNQCSDDMPSRRIAAAISRNLERLRKGDDARNQLLFERSVEHHECLERAITRLERAIDLLIAALGLSGKQTEALARLLEKEATEEQTRWITVTGPKPPTDGMTLEQKVDRILLKLGA